MKDEELMKAITDLDDTLKSLTTSLDDFCGSFDAVFSGNASMEKRKVKALEGIEDRLTRIEDLLKRQVIAEGW